MDEAPAPSLVPADAPGPATSRSHRALALLESVYTTMRDVEYRHATRIDRRAGVYHFDCSGLCNWVLGRVSKTALAALDRERPVAATYERTIRHAHPGRVRNGWRNVMDLEEVCPGDVFAWKRPPDWPRKNSNTGHVGFVIDKPRPLAGFAGLEGHEDVTMHAYLVRVVDSTRWAHHEDTREEGGTGFGLGTLLFVTDAERRPTHYGWHGPSSHRVVATSIAFGRF
jgi:hypothetical protein